MATIYVPELAPIKPVGGFDITPIETVNIAIEHLIEVTGSQFVNFRDKTQCAQLQRRTFNRFIIKDTLLTFGLWRHGDDINLHFVTMDNENRWAEVVTEALGVEVGSKVLREATKNGTLDLTDERLCHFKDGRRTQYWFLKHANPAKCRIVLHYCRISTEWLGRESITTHFQEMKEPLPNWPESLPEKSYTHNMHSLLFLHWICMEPDAIPIIRAVYPYARAWAELNDLWTPALVNAATLFCALAGPFVKRRYDDQATGDRMLITALDSFVVDGFQKHVPVKCRSALRTAAKDSLDEVEMMLTTVRTARASLAASPQANQPPSPTKQQPPLPTPAPSKQKFRDAGSALSRLRFDISHAEIEYDVGYADRFEGLKWMGLAKWGGKDTEDEDWIPEHRVKKIVRVWDGAVIWDREKRVDRTGEV